jgi:hypothetical protein
MGELVTSRGETVHTCSPQLPSPCLLFNGVERLMRDDHLRVCPSGDLDHHVQDALLLIRIERYVVHGRDDPAIVLDIHPVFCTHRP